MGIWGHSLGDPCLATKPRPRLRVPGAHSAAGTRLTAGDRTLAQWPVAGRGQKPLFWWGEGAPTLPLLPAFAVSSCPRRPRTLNTLSASSPAARSHPVPPRFIPPHRPPPHPGADLGMGWGGGNRMARVPLDSAVRAGLEGERSCPKMVTFIPFFKLKRGGSLGSRLKFFSAKGILY